MVMYDFSYIRYNVTSCSSAYNNLSYVDVEENF